MAGKSVVVAGAGGNIGSHLTEHLARMPEVERVVLIDRDVYEARNMANQSVLPVDVGRPKAMVQARRMTELRPDMEVCPVYAPLESLPLAQWRADLIVTCLDSRAARQVVNERAWRLGVPWVDSGVLDSESLSPGWLARVNVYVPGDSAPCLECAWSEGDYRLLEQEYPCAAGKNEPHPTGAPSALGALAAALVALECRKMLGGDRETAAIGRQFTVNARWHGASVTTFRRNPGCRFDHAMWPIERCLRDPGRTRIADLIAGGAVSLPSQRFSMHRSCPLCGHGDAGFHVASRTAPCADCGCAMVTPGFAVVETLNGDLPLAALNMTLADVGLRVGDVLETAAGYWELAPTGVTEREK